MKFRLILVTFLLSFLVVGTAYAVPYSVNFDADGALGNYSPVEIWGWDVEGVTQFDVGGSITDTRIIQDLGVDNILNDGDRFEEEFTTLVTNGVDALGNVLPPPYWGAPESNLYFDVFLEGYIYDYDNGIDGQNTTRSNFTAIQDDSYVTQMDDGNAILYTDVNGDNKYVAADGDINVATFSFNQAAPSTINPTVWPGGGGLATYSVVLNLDTYNATYWSDAGSSSTPFDELVSKGFILTYNEGSVQALGLEGEPGSPAPGPDGNDTIVLGYNDRGIDIAFDVVPEPTTMLLFGFGLLGLAGIGRKRS